MRDVGERAAMHQRRGTGDGLHEIWHQRVAQQHGHRAVGLQVARGDGGAVAARGNDDAPEAFLQVAEVGGQAEHRHDLGGDGDIEPVFARGAVGDAAEAVDDAAQRAVVHVQRAAERYPAAVDAEGVSPVDVVVDHRREQVVGGSDGVKVAGEMEVDLLHRQDLGVAAAGGAAFLAEAGAEARFAQADHGAGASGVKRIAEADRGGGLALAGGGGADAGDQDQLAGRAGAGRVHEVEADLGLVAAIRFQGLGGNASLFCDFRDWTEFGGAGDV